MTTPSFSSPSRGYSTAWFVLPALFLLWIGFLAHEVADWAFSYGSTTELPPYSIAVDGGKAPQWTDGPDPIFRLGLDERLSLLLRPAQPVTSNLVLRAFRGRGNQMRRWAAPFVPLSSGGFALRARPSELPELAIGLWDIALLVGTKEALPKNPHELPAGPGGSGWQVLRFRLEIRSEARPGPLLSAKNHKSAPAVSNRTRAVRMLPMWANSDTPSWPT